MPEIIPAVVQSLPASNSVSKVHLLYAIVLIAIAAAMVLHILGLLQPFERALIEWLKATVVPQLKQLIPK